MKVQRRVGLVCLAVSLVSGMLLLGAGCLSGTVVLTDDTGDFLTTGRTLSHFQAVQVDPRSEDSAGPQFVVAGDVNNDGLLDLVSAWNQSQPVQVHIQRRDSCNRISFETTSLAGSVPVVSVAGLGVADFDNDAHLDIAVLIKETARGGAGCLDSEIPEGGLSGAIITYFGPTDPQLTNRALAWEEVEIGSSLLQGAGDANSGPGSGGFTSMTIGDVDRSGTMDLVVGWNSDCAQGTTDVVVFSNLGAGQSRDGTWTSLLIPNPFIKGTAVRDVALGDVDGDGDLDIVATYPDSQAMNVRWFRNPTVDVPDDFHISDGGWQVGSIGQVATGADGVRIGDIDRDGRVDVVVCSIVGGIVQWFRGPTGPTTAPLRSIPWQVYSLAEFTDRVPESIALGDLNFDGQPELVASAEGGLAWFDSDAALTVYDQWIERMIIDDLANEENDTDPATTDPNVEPTEVAGTTSINAILVADIDSDGVNDIVTTLDRSGESGLSNDALVWFRNLRRPN